MIQIHTYHARFKDGIVVETEEGRIEAVVTNFPDQASIFTLAEVTFDEDGNPVITNRYISPVQSLEQCFCTFSPSLLH